MLARTVDPRLSRRCRDSTHLGCRTGAAALAAWLALSWADPARAQPPEPRRVQGVVSQVTDGDSLWIEPPGRRDVEVRLRDIDAPEICQAWGEEARRALEALVLGKTVVLHIAGRDAYGRTLGDVRVDGVDVGAKMVGAGHAWGTRARRDPGPLAQQERLARTLKRGLHGLPGAVLPRVFRQVHGPCLAGLAADRAPATPAPTARHRCDGRQYCSQMTSCDEARYFLKNCPGVQMDGDGDGLPCETQWCRRAGAVISPVPSATR